MPGLSTAVNRNPYPYSIIPLDMPSEGKLRALVSRRGWGPVEEFIRVESLLRSKQVQNLYLQCETDRSFNNNPEYIRDEFGRILQARYGVQTDDALRGGHHGGLYLEEENDESLNTRWLDGGALNMTEQLKHPNPRVRQRLAETFKTILLNENDARYLTVQFDLEFPAKPALLAVHRLIKRKQRTLSVSPFRDLAAWITYFRCFDLRASGLSFGEIAQEIFGNIDGKSAQVSRQKQSRYDSAERACKKVKRAILAAESRSWPPRNL